jgi:cobalt/nickel transport system permease protein
MNREIPAFLLHQEIPAYSPEKKTGKLSMAFIDRTLKRMASVVRSSILQYEISSHFSKHNGISAQTILLFYISYIVCIGLAHDLISQAIFSCILLVLAVYVSARLKYIYRNAFILSFFFGFLVMLPAALNVFTPGKVVLKIFQFPSEKTFLMYHIPAVVGITDEGVKVVLRMFLKVFNSISLTFLILHVLSLYRLIKALRIIRVPGVFILTITLTYKFIFILSQTIEEMYLAMKARWVGEQNQNDTRRIIAGRIGFLFRKSWMRYEETYHAMVARGFSGSITITGLEKMNAVEIFILLIAAGIGIAVVKYGELIIP